MVSSDNDRQDPVQPFEAAMRKLGWMSAHSRQTVIARHMLRNIANLSPSEYPVPGEPYVQQLDCLRAALTILSGVNRELRIFSSPYAPENSPDTHFIAYYRKRRVFSTSIASGMPDVTFFFKDHGELGLENSSGLSMEDQILVHETYWLGKGVSLSNKTVADDRVPRLINQPLWQNVKSAELSNAKLYFEEWKLREPKAATFWQKWYFSLVDGAPLELDLQRRVALIEQEVWDAGPDAVAEETARIEAEYLADKAPQAERIEFNAQSRKFFVVPIEVAKPDLLGATLSQVQDALEDVLANPGNGISETSRETRVLRRVFAKYGNDPQQIEMGFVSVHKGLTRQILVGEELPASEENLALMDALDEGAKAVRATHPEVAENRKIINEQALRELPEGARETLEEALPVLAAISDDRLADDWLTDIPQLINDATLPLPSGAPPLPGVDESMRIFSRAAKISLKLRVQGVLSKIEESSGYRAARILGTIAGLVALGLSIF